MQLTYKCKINNREVFDVLNVLGERANSLYNCALWECYQNWKETGKIYSNYDLRNLMRRNENYHFKMLYSNCAEETVFDVGRAFKSWFKLRKKDDKARPPGYKESGGITPFQHTANCGFKFQNDNVLRLSLSNLAKQELERQYIYMQLSKPPQLDYDKVCAIRFVKYDSGWWVNCTMNIEIPDVTGTNVCAIDMGIINFAALAMTNGYTSLYSGRELLSQLHYYNKEISKCKPRNWKPGSKNKSLSRRAKRLYKKRRDKQNEFVHCVSKHIVNVCVANDVHTILIGDLTDIRKDKNYGKKMNQKLHNWPFASFTEKLEYKSALNGIRLEQVGERYTSQTCSVCGQVKKSNRKHRGLYVCDCGNVINADINGAINILQFYTEERFDNFQTPVIIHYRPFETEPLQIK